MPIHSSRDTFSQSFVDWYNLNIDVIARCLRWIVYFRILDEIIAIALLLLM